MATSLTLPRRRNLAQALEKLGKFSPERIGLPAGTATEQDLVDALEAANKRLFELVDGFLVEKTLDFRDSVIGTYLGTCLGEIVMENDLGILLGADGPFRIKPGRIRMPDVCFVSWDSLPNQKLLDESILDAVPDLAVEVVNKSNTPKEMSLKLKDYFKAGVKLVWYIYPIEQIAEVYTSPTSKKILKNEDTLDGGKVLPGFRLQLRKLFVRAKPRSRGRGQ